MTFVKLLSSLLAMIGIKIVSESFSLEEYGTYSQALLIVSTTASITILGMTDGVNYWFNNQSVTKDSRLSAVSTLFCLQSIVGVLGGCCILIFNTRFSDYFDNPSLGATYIWIAFQPLLTNLLPMLQNLYISIGQAKLIAIRNLILSIFRLLVFVCACCVTKDIITILAACFLFDLMQTIYFFVLLRKYDIHISIKQFDSKIIIRLLKFCIPMALFIVLNSLLRDIDKWIVGYLGNTNDVAIYANCSRVLPFDMLTTSIAMVLVPIITRYFNTDISKVAAVFKTYLNLSFITTAIFVLPAVILSKDLLLSLYAPDYLPGLTVFILYLLVDLIRFANISILFYTSGRSQELMWIACIGLFLNSVMGILFYKVLGLNGPAVATVTVMSIMSVIYFYRGSKILNHNILNLFDYKNIVCLLLEISVLGILLIFLSQKMVHLDVIVRFLIIYIPAVIILGLLNKKSITENLRLLNGVK